MPKRANRVSDLTTKMLVGAQNHCNTRNASASAAVTVAAAAAAAAAAASKNATDFSIAAIMSRSSSSREPSERSLSKFFLVFYSQKSIQ